MNIAIGITGLAALMIGLGLLLRLLSKRSKHVLATTEDVVSLKARMSTVVERAGESLPYVVAMLKVSEHFVQRATHALECDQLVRARLHINLVSMVLAWAETVIEDLDADTVRARTTKQLTVALALLKENKFDLAVEDFQMVWLDQYAHMSAKRLALMGRLWIHASRGEHQEAAEAEQLLVLLPKTAPQDFDLNMTIKID